MPLEFKAAYQKTLHANARRITHGHDGKSLKELGSRTNEDVNLKISQSSPPMPNSSHGGPGHFLQKNNSLDPSQIQAVVAAFDAVLAMLILDMTAAIWETWKI